VLEPMMLTKMTEDEWAFTVDLFRAVRSRRGDKGRDDRKFLEALHYFSVHNITWRALPAEFGNWNSVWKRFWRLSQRGVFEAFFQALAELSETAHLVQMFDSTVVRAHVSAAGAKGGKTVRRSAARVAGSRRKSTSKPTSRETRSTST
jgi:transposase